MNTVPSDREVIQVEVTHGPMTYHFWRHHDRVTILVGCHKVRLTPTEARQLAAAATAIADLIECR